MALGIGLGVVEADRACRAFGSRFHRKGDTRDREDRIRRGFGRVSAGCDLGVAGERREIRFTGDGRRECRRNRQHGSVERLGVVREPNADFADRVFVGVTEHHVQVERLAHANKRRRKRRRVLCLELRAFRLIRLFAMRAQVEHRRVRRRGLRECR